MDDTTTDTSSVELDALAVAQLEHAEAGDADLYRSGDEEEPADALDYLQQGEAAP